MVKHCCFCKVEGGQSNGLFSLSALMKKELKLKQDSIYSICISCLSSTDEVDNLMITNKEICTVVFI